MSTSPPVLRPIVAVIGTTGVGKSQLAVSLAQSLASNGTSGGQGRYPAVVLSADSMQLYKGLDVITNKVTVEEMGGVDHWGLDMVSPGDGSWEVGKWCNEADQLISSIPSSTLPIICGGTHYFIQHFLFPPAEMSLDRPDKGKCASEAWAPPGPRPPVPSDLDPALSSLLDTFWTHEPQWPGVQAKSEASSSRRPTVSDDGQLLALHQLLLAVDPKEGGRWHWRDGRKVRRGLERWWERGGAIEPSGGDRAPGEGRRARFRTLIFWVYEPLEALRPRLDKRVDKMVENGLLNEIVELRGAAEKIYGSCGTTDHTEGIFQSIGYKEFAALRLPQDNPSTDPTYASALERTKLSTQQYAKSQLKWIKKQLLPAVREAKSLGGEVEVYVVNGGDQGVNPAVGVLHDFLNMKPLPSAREIGHADAADLLALLEAAGSAKIPDTATRQDINARKDCVACSLPGKPCSIGMTEWDHHIRSKTHRRNANPVKRDKEAWITAQRMQGETKRAERDKLKEELASLKALQTDREP